MLFETNYIQINKIVSTSSKNSILVQQKQTHFRQEVWLPTLFLELRL